MREQRKNPWPEQGVKYQISEISGEFRTRAGESWTERELSDAFSRETSVDPHLIATFEAAGAAYDYFDTLTPNWWESRTNIGMVLLGNFYQIEKVKVNEFGDAVEILEVDYKFGDYRGED